ncbi:MULTISPECIES: 3-keto-5-aminohexanoate cleavage protein [unclassified Sphingomonas]|uniref:3-keto-5-aminohexanoate cleavage protein n=1 Tax=unclassified Sphingomonas TaxID=196159 RepID=UPI002151F95D|nr:MULTISPECIES: 3-keto-5-aminohexanoate cleavage protein [unclassified Sphingomonas]MCR5870150.1 3-keto-5-aminohexanoate cleavage protein [Sphingomonas sp. J344]UUX98160.1 3-keto-5-aminohexanoate cleavage protein [Sphingomonas sp. J315]
MQFLDDSLLPRNQEKLVITVAPYGPEWMPEDFPEDIPVTIDEQVQKAVDCYNAGATVLHLHCREPDGHGSKRLSVFNEVIDRIRTAVPDMIIQVGGSISFAPESEEDGAQAKWLTDEVRHMLADLTPAPEQVTIAVNTTQMNIMDLMHDEEYRQTTLGNPALYHAYREMVVPAGPEWVEEHLRRLTASGIQPHFQLTCMPDLETVERLVRRGHYKGPLNLTWVGIGGGFDGPNPANFMEFIRRAPDGSTITLESVMGNVLPINTIAMALGMHCRCGNEDNIYDTKGNKMGSIAQVEQLVRIARELGRDVANGQEARAIYKIGTQYNSTEETLARLGMAPNRERGTLAVPIREMA